MKKLSLFATAALALGLAANASAAIITSGAYAGTDVGAADIEVAYTHDLGGCGPGSSPVAETCWVNTVLNPDVTYVTKTDTVAYYATNVAGLFALKLVGTPSYFLINNTSNDWILFQNVANSGWAVFGGYPDANIGGAGQITVSHVDEFSGGPAASVPEPATLGLLGMGLLGVGLLRRRKASQG